MIIKNKIIRYLQRKKYYILNSLFGFFQEQYLLLRCVPSEKEDSRRKIVQKCLSIFLCGLWYYYRSSWDVTSLRIVCNLFCFTDLYHRLYNLFTRPFDRTVKSGYQSNQISDAEVSFANSIARMLYQATSYLSRGFINFSCEIFQLFFCVFLSK